VPPSPGHGWAARRELIERHGFYDVMILGGGDSMLARAAFGLHEDAADALDFNPRQRTHYHPWAKRFHGDVRGQVGFVDTPLHHLWHGELSERRYFSRYRGMKKFDFDPFRDIGLGKDSQCWRWKSEKPELRDYVRRYFESRNEDGEGRAASVQRDNRYSFSSSKTR